MARPLERQPASREQVRYVIGLCDVVQEYLHSCPEDLSATEACELITLMARLKERFKALKIQWQYVRSWGREDLNYLDEEDPDVIDIRDMDMEEGIW